MKHFLIKNEKGFTLIEVLIAMAIVSIALLALMKAISSSLFIAATLEDKVKSRWLQNQTITLIELGLIPLKTSEDTTKSFDFLGERWYTRIHAAGSLLPSLEKITISVSKSPTGPFMNSISAFRYLP